MSSRWVVPGGEPAIEVLRVEPTPHAAEMLAVYLPGAQLLFQGVFPCQPTSLYARRSRHCGD